MSTTRMPIYTTSPLKMVTRRIIHLQAQPQKNFIEFKKWKKAETMKPSLYTMNISQCLKSLFAPMIILLTENLLFGGL